MGLSKVCRVFTGIHWVLPSFTEFYWVFKVVTGFHWVSLGFMRLNQI